LRRSLESVFFNPVLRRFLEAVGFTYIVWLSLLAKILSLTRCKNKVKTSLLAKALGSLARYKNKVRASLLAKFLGLSLRNKVRAGLLAKVLDSLRRYVSVVSKGQL
jgi:hypothetical protein